MANLEALRAEIEALENPVFAVLDGAQFDNLPDALLDGDFVHKPLYLDRGDGNRDQTITAPQLVWLDRDMDSAPGHEDAPAPDILDRLFDLIGDKPAAVFWECPAGGDVLYKHLRGINMVMVSNDISMDRGKSYERSPLPSPNVHNTSRTNHDAVGYECVLFRHADANVMAQILPVLSETQFARIFGPTTHIIFAPGDDWAIGSPTMIAPKPKDLPATPSGPLKLDADTLKNVESQRKNVRSKRVIKHVRGNLPPEFAGMSDKQLSEQVNDAIVGAESYGVDQEAAFSRWSYMYVLTGGAVNRDPQIRKFMVSDTFVGSPNTKAKQVMDALIYGLGRKAS